MRVFIACAVAVSVSLVQISSVEAQPTDHAGMRMGGPVLFLARPVGKEVVGGSASTATATAAVTVDPAKNAVSFDLTYHGLTQGAAKRIALHNFGVGGHGAVVGVLCGEGAAACPGLTSARIAGTIRSLKLNGDLLSEFASSRVYLEIIGGDGKPELRGQLEANGAMVPVRNYTARLMPNQAPGTAGEGTAVLSETYLPGGKVAVEYSVTVAGTAGAPEAAALVSAPRASPAKGARFLAASQLPDIRVSEGAGPGGTGKGGGSFNGAYTVAQVGPRALMAGAFLRAGNAPVITVRTSRFPDGELFGVFVPVN